MKVVRNASNGDVRVECVDIRESLAEAVKDLSFEDTLDMYGRLDEAYSGKGLKADFMRNMCLVDRFFLLTVVLKRKDLLTKWQFDACRDVERQPDGVLDLWARGHGKSSIITYGGVIQEILRDRDIAICIFSNTKANARKFMASVKETFESNGLLIDLFPDILYEKPKRDAQKWSMNEGLFVRRSPDFRGKKDPTLSASGLVDGLPTGAHFDLRVYDDVVTPESVTTPEQIEKTTTQLGQSQNLTTMDGKGREWYIGTRYSHADTYGHMIKTDKKLRVRVKAATHDGTFEGRSVFMPQFQLDKMRRTMSDSTFACQMLLNPLAGGLKMFRDEWFMPYDVRPSSLNVYIMVDPASSMKKGSDRTAMAVVGIDPQGHMYLLDGYCHRMPLSEKFEKLCVLWTRWKNEPGVQGVWVGYEQFGAQSDVEFFRLEMEKKKIYFDIKTLTFPKSGSSVKYDRIARLQPALRNGTFHLPAIIFSSDKRYYWRMVRKDMSGNVMTFQPGEEEKGGMVVMETLEYKGDTKLMREKPKHKAKCLARKDEDGKIYDLTELFINEAKLVPSPGQHDDFVDAVSRIYDMDLNLPMPVRQDGNWMPEAFDY